MFKSRNLARLYAAFLFACIIIVPTVAFADPLDELQTKMGAFLTKAGLIATGLVLPTGSLTVTVLALKRKAAKVMGDDEAMQRTGNQIVDAIKLTAIAGGASLLTAIAGGIMQ
jgi:hypothetical protein